jgi:hypothetical protein
MPSMVTGWEYELLIAGFIGCCIYAVIASFWKKK